MGLRVELCKFMSITYRFIVMPAEQNFPKNFSNKQRRNLIIKHCTNGNSRENGNGFILFWIKNFVKFGILKKNGMQTISQRNVWNEIKFYNIIRYDTLCCECNILSFPFLCLLLLYHKITLTWPLRTIAETLCVVETVPI